MKKFFTCALCTIMSLNIMAWEYEMPEFEWSVGADIVSAYLWRGMNSGGFSLQPDLNISYAGLEADLWFNVGTTDWTFSDMAPELDFTLQYSIAGLTLGFTHEFYFVENQRFFDFHRMTKTEYLSEDAAEGYNFNVTEVFAQYDFSEVFEEVPLTISWYTRVAGDDAYLDDNNNIKQAFSTYISAAYDWEIIEGLKLTPTLAISPWRSIYNDYEGKFSMANISLKLNYEKELSDHFSFNVWAEGCLRPYNLNKDNIIISARNSTLNHADQRLNGAIGVGFYFY